MAIGADSHLRVVVSKELLPVLAGFVAVELVGGQAVGIHPPHITVAAGAELGNGALRVRSLEILRGVRHFILGFEVAAVAVMALDAGFSVSTGDEQFALLLVTGDTAFFR